MDFFQSTTYFTVYRGGSNGLFKRKLHFAKDPEVSNVFPGGGPTFSGGQNANFYGNPYNQRLSRGRRIVFRLSKHN